MLQLYYGSGSREVNLLEPVRSEAWGRLRRNACRLMRESGESECAEVLERIPFVLWSGTNSFGDEFKLLHAEVSARDYLELEKEVDSGAALWKYRQIAETLAKLNAPVRFVTVDVETSEEIETVPTPELKITSDVVMCALKDAETLIASRGAPSGLDRVHTVFHGYLKAACNDAHISFEDDASVTDLFKRLRENHPRLQATPPGGVSIERVLRAMATIVDALNSLRNRSSLAHPNEMLLEENEAMLMVNSVRTLLHYLDAKLR